MAIAADADYCPVSARREILGVLRSTAIACLHPESTPVPDPIDPDALVVQAESRGGCESKRVKASLGRRGVVAGRRRISRIM